MKTELESKKMVAVFAALVLMAACCTCSALLTVEKELVVHSGSCPSVQAVFQWSHVYTLAGLDQASCWGKCAETGNCLFAHFDTGNVCSQFLLADATQTRTDCGSRMGAPFGKFLLPRLALQVAVSPHYPVGKRSYVDAITGAASRIRDQFLSGNTSPLRLFPARTTSVVSFMDDVNSAQWAKNRGMFEEGLCCGYWDTFWALQRWGGDPAAVDAPKLGKGSGSCDRIYNHAMQKDASVTLDPTVFVAEGSNVALLGRDAVWTQVFEPIFTATFVKTERITGFTAHERFKAYPDLCNRPGICPEDRVSIDGMGWDREPTFALPASLLVQLFEVGAGDQLSMALIASMSVSTQAQANLAELVNKVPPESLCNQPASCADVLGAIGKTAGTAAGGPAGGQAGAAVAKFICNPIDKLLCPNQPPSLYMPAPTSAPVVPPVPAPVTAPPVPAPVAAPPPVAAPTPQPTPRRPPNDPCGRRCIGWMSNKNVSTFFDEMSEDCETVNGIPTREFWASISDAPDARALLTANYATCKGVRPVARVAKRCDGPITWDLPGAALASQGSSSTVTTGSSGRVEVVAGVATVAGVLALIAVAVVAKRRSHTSVVESPEMLL